MTLAKCQLWSNSPLWHGYMSSVWYIKVFCETCILMVEVVLVFVVELNLAGERRCVLCGDDLLEWDDLFHFLTECIYN